MRKMKQEEQEGGKDDMWLRENVEVKEEDIKCKIEQVERCNRKLDVVLSQDEQMQDSAKSEEDEDEVMIIKKGSETEEAELAKHGQEEEEPDKEMTDSTRVAKLQKTNLKDIFNKDDAVPTWKEAIRLATISDKVENLCRYKCPKCDWTFVSRSQLAYHFGKTLHVNNNNKTRNCFDMYLIHAVMHKCKVCSKRILCDKHMINMHIRSCHKINFMVDYKLMTLTEQKAYKERFDETKKTLRSIKDYSQSESVGNLCLYKCKKCDKIFETKTNLKNHFRQSFHATEKEINFDNYLIKTTIHKCKICSTIMLCEIVVIRDHMKHTLKMGSIKEYIDITGVEQTTQNRKKMDRLNLFCKENSDKYKISKDEKMSANFLVTCVISQHFLEYNESIQ